MSRRRLPGVATARRLQTRAVAVLPRPLVLDAGQSVRVEVDGGELASPQARVAVVAHWSATALVSHSFEVLVTQLRANGYAVIVVSTADSSGPLTWHGGSAPQGVSVLRRPNVGYDFGSWATALARFPLATGADRVLLLNDSLVGPFEPITSLLESFHETRADAWGMTETAQFGRHLQSFALGFPSRTLQDPVVERFWRGIRVERRKEAVVWRNEIGLSRLLRHRGLSIEAAISAGAVGVGRQNPTIIGWRRLLDLGFPFVKRELLTDPTVAPDADDVPAELTRRYGVDVGEWL